MERITIDYSKSFRYLRQSEIDALDESISLCHDMVHNGTGLGSEYLGWVDLPDHNDREEFARMQAAAEKIRRESEVFLVVGIGGSYLGARAAIEMLSHSFYNELPREKRNGPKIYYVGHNLSSTYLQHLLEIIAGQDISIKMPVGA
jgi:glucose-6-phosphate isomerase